MAVSAKEALERLQEGNRRFMEGDSIQRTAQSHQRREALLTGQQPFAIVLGCSDSRVPPEIIFDQNLGDLFVIRVAGNIAGPSQVGSIEFAAKELGARLVVVLGHSNCGAIRATLEALGHPPSIPSLSSNLRSIIDEIRRSVEAFGGIDPRRDRNTLMREAVRANIISCANHLRRRSETLDHLVRNGEIFIVGAEYSLASGAVDFFHGVSDIG